MTEIITSNGDEMSIETSPKEVYERMMFYRITVKQVTQKTNKQQKFLKNLMSTLQNEGFERMIMYLLERIDTSKYKVDVSRWQKGSNENYVRVEITQISLLQRVKDTLKKLSFRVVF